MPAHPSSASVGLLRVAILCVLPALSIIALPANAAPVATVETAAQEIVGLATSSGSTRAGGGEGKQGAGGFGGRGAPGGHPPPAGVAPPRGPPPSPSGRPRTGYPRRCRPAPEHGDTDVSLGIELAACTWIHGRAAA